MKLQPVSLQGRRFLIQFDEIMTEFGQVIPWLNELNNLRYVTNGRVFRDRFLVGTGQADGEIVPYQFVENNEAGTFVGGCLHFARTPEHFRDRRNVEAVERLTATGRSFVSCFQIRPVFRGRGLGANLWRRSMQAVVRIHGPVWGVISDSTMVRWYESMGARIHSPRVNLDRLWIAEFSQPPLQPNPPARRT